MQVDWLLKVILLESMVCYFFHDTNFSFNIVILEACICSNLVVKHVCLLPLPTELQILPYVVM
jgi:hypothetical protein